MRIPYSDYKDVIPDAADEQVRTNHVNCPAGRDERRRLYIKRTHTGVMAYCHNCGGQAIRTMSGRRSPHLIKQLLWEDEQRQKKGEVLLPEDTTTILNEFHNQALAWLYKSGLRDEDIQNHSIGYSPSWHRVILPVYNSGRLVFWQGRRLEGNDDKYVSVSGAVKPLHWACSRAPLGVPTLVITEDMLSAIRVGLTDLADGVALLGTSAPDDLIHTTLGYQRVCVWLDNDEAGRSKATELFERIRCVHSGTVLNIAYLKEPKSYSRAELEHILG